MEGPSLVILREELDFLTNQKITDVRGNSKIDFEQVKGKKIKAFRSFGKHFLIELEQVTIRIHFLMFGSYRINEEKETPLRLGLQFANKAVVNFYSCAISLLTEDLDQIYDWRSDVMSPKWDPKLARKKLKQKDAMNVGDALLDQDIFAGVGNIIKNEVLYRVQIHPASVVGALPPRLLTRLINEAWLYSQEFYELKKIFELRKHWQVYKKKYCKRCELPLVLEYTGTGQRRTFFCSNCQVLYS
jgi:endonuclease VIII